MSLNVCRLCLTDTVDTMDIFSYSCKEFDYQLKIQTLFSILVKPTDPLKAICQECIDRITDFYNFWERVKQSQLQLAKGTFLNSKYYSEGSINNIKKEICDYEQGNILNITPDLLQIQVSKRDEKERNYNKGMNVPVEFSPCDIKGKTGPRDSFSDQKPEDIGSCLSPLRIDNHLDDGCSDDPMYNGENFYQKDTLLTEPVFDLSKFPAELIKNGKMLIKRKKMDNLISKFYNLQCFLCENGQKFKRVFLLLKHIKTVHQTRGYVTCYCNTRLYNHRTINFHMAKHLQPSAFECPICKKTVAQPLVLKSHMQTHLPQDGKKFKCNECTQSYSSKELLKCHIESSHVPEGERKIYKCEICGKEYKIKLSLHYHMRTQHPTPGSPNLLCSECGKTLQSKTLMRIHMLVHHDEAGKNKVHCTQCGIICKNAFYLKAHEKLHSGERFRCPQCPYSSHRRHQLVRHTRVRHSDEKPFMCTECGKSFKLKTLLKQHSVQHTGEAKYSCSFCSRTFMSAGNCSSHRQRMHPEEYKREKTRKHNERFKMIEPQPRSEKEEINCTQQTNN